MIADSSNQALSRWSQDEKLRLAQMWTEGFSASQIALDLGKTRNAVISAVHRNGLAKAQPIDPGLSKRASSKRASSKGASAKGGCSKPVRRFVSPSLTSSPRLNLAQRRRALARGLLPQALGHLPQAQTEELIHNQDRGGQQACFASDLSQARVRFFEAREAHCRWPLGDPVTPDFRFCGELKTLGSSYCDQHHALAYRRAVSRADLIGGLAHV
jgi:GcrA cell cycle regulator